MARQVYAGIYRRSHFGEMGLAILTLTLSSLVGGSGYAWQEPSSGPVTEVAPAPSSAVNESVPEGATESVSDKTGTTGSATLSFEADEPTDSSEPDVRPASFQEITPGESSLDDVLRLLGEPVERVSQSGKTTLLYRTGTLFSKVEIVVEDELVNSIVMHLAEPAPVSKVATDLDLKQFHASVVPDDAGQSLGLVYPERGILLSFHSGSLPPRIGQILLERVTAEGFVHRVMFDGGHRFSQNMADLNLALRLDSNNADAYWLRSRVRQAMGDYENALKDAEQAVKLDSSHAQYRLTRAHIYYITGKHDQAIKEVRSVISRNQDPEIEARAECLLGDLIAGGPARNPKLALEHHQNSVRLATPLAKDQRPAVRRSAKRILIDAYLGAANDIAVGRFTNKRQVVPKWLTMAQDLADKTVENDRGDPTMGLVVRSGTLTALCAMGAGDDADGVIEELFDSGRELIADARDPLYQRHLEWELGESLMHAARYHQDQGNSKQSLTYANNALALLEPLVELRPPSPKRDHVLGKLYFFVGLANALEKKAHGEAITHYEKAIPFLSSPLPTAEMDDVGLHGERFVSMGVSFWEAGDRKQAMSVTKEGVHFLDQGVKEGRVDKRTLAIPYDNLAAMYQAQGQPDEAKTLAAMAQKINSDTKVIRR